MKAISSRWNKGSRFSSRSSTTRQSHSITRAISLVSAWSQSFQPSRCASAAAISPPPLPYSRSIVSTRIMRRAPAALRVGPKVADGGRLSQARCGWLLSHDPPDARLVFLQGEGEEKHDRGRHGQVEEGIEVRQR